MFSKRILDQMHKAFVVVCFGVTVVGTGYLGLRAGHYMLYVRPEVVSLREKLDRKLLEEGKSKDLLSDSAPSLRT